MPNLVGRVPLYRLSACPRMTPARGLSAQADWSCPAAAAVALDLAEQVEVHVDAGRRDDVEVALETLVPVKLISAGGESVVERVQHLARGAGVDYRPRRASPARRGRRSAASDLGARRALSARRSAARGRRARARPAARAPALRRSVTSNDVQRCAVLAGECLRVASRDEQPPALDPHARVLPRPTVRSVTMGASLSQSRRYGQRVGWRHAGPAGELGEGVSAEAVQEGAAHPRRRRRRPHRRTPAEGRGRSPPASSPTGSSASASPAGT